MTEVVVVGAGPAGLVTSMALAAYDVDVLLVDKRDQLSTVSRALAFSTRSMELLRGWGLEERVRAEAADVRLRAWVSPSLTAAQGTEMPLGFPDDHQLSRLTPAPPAWVAQSRVEPLLLDLLLRRPSVTVRRGVEFVALGTDGEGVTVSLRGRQGSVEAVRPRYVVGADGAHSPVRTGLRIGMDGAGEPAEYHRVEFTAALGPVVGDRRYGLYVVTNPDANGVLAPHGRGDVWGFSWEWRPGQPRLIDEGEEALIEHVRTAVGVPDLSVTVERVSTFGFAAQLAERYREGVCFLAGDAAHRMTPRGGTGMNTAVQDALDLGWKLGWVLRGWATPTLLDSYETERRPVGRHNVERSASPSGARSEGDDALVWDLNGRLTHHWVRPGVSTLDLVGPGLTLLTGPKADGWRERIDELDARLPVALHTLSPEAAEALDLTPRGAVLVRPDAKPVASWTAPALITCDLPLR